MTQDSGAGQSASRGAALLVVTQLVKFVVNITGVVVLSYFVTPAEVGIVTVAWAIVSAGEILRDFGLSAAVIRTPNVTHGERDNLFWANSAIGFVLAGLVVAASPLAAVGFDLPALGPVLALLSVVFILNGFSAQYRADLNRRRRFRQLALVDLIAPAMGLAAAIPAGVLGYGYWAIAVQYIVMAVMTLVIVGVLAKWLPGLPSRKHSVRKYIGFGYRVALSQGMSYLGNNIDTLALGAFSTAANVGFYGRAYQLTVSPLMQLRTPANAIAVPTLSRHRPESAPFMKLLLRGQLLVGWLSLPLAALMAAAHQPIIAIALGPEWTPTAPIFAILAVAGGLQSLSAVANWAFLTVGDGRALRNYSALALGTKLILVLSVAWMGAFAVGLAFLGSVVVLWPIAVIWALRVAGLRAAPVLKQGFKLLALHTVAGALGYATVLLTSFGPWMTTVCAGLSILVVYALAAFLPAARRDYSSIWDEAIGILPARLGRKFQWGSVTDADS